MGQEYSMEVVQKAEDLYCTGGHTFDQVATLTGVARSTLLRWSDLYGWRDKREQVRQAMSSIPIDDILTRAAYGKKLLASLDPNDAHAVARLQEMAIKTAQWAAAKQATTPPEPEAAREIKTEEDMVSALEEALQMKCNMILSTPMQVSLASIKDIAKGMEFLASMRGKLQPESSPAGQPGEADKVEPESTESREPGMSAEMAKWIRENVLGVRKPAGGANG